MGFETPSKPQAQEQTNDLEARRADALSRGQILHEDAEAAESADIVRAREQAAYWEGVANGHKAKLEQLKGLSEDANGNIVDPENGTTTTKREAVKALEGLIAEAQSKQAEEESKIVSKL